MKTFSGKTVLITGASSGIGEAFAKKLASEKANLILTARSEESIKSLASNLENEHGIKAYAFPEDLSRPGSAKKLYQKIKESNLPIDVLINNAGFGKNGKFLDFEMKTYASMIELNITSLIELSHLCLPKMLEKNDGGIINVASASAFVPFPYFSVYSATKWFVLSFSEALSGEYKDTGITIMALCPGGTATNFFNIASPNGITLSQNLDTSEFVVNQGIEGFLKGKSCLVVGLRKYIMSLIPRFLPRKTVINLMLKYLKQITNKND